MKTRILLAEDNTDAAEIVSIVLKHFGYEVILAHDGVEAVKNAVTFEPDLILMDLMMPRMDGLEATAHIRQHPKTKSIPIIAATAMATSEGRKKCLAAGCDEYLPKPISPKQLAEAIRKLLRDRGCNAAEKSTALVSGALRH
ncbi:MAG TPA: response regulator [Candidatus Eisenbacteria bacterium]|nr:response regulator [Candidatus Eisenbacteria bacterium]